MASDTSRRRLAVDGLDTQVPKGAPGGSRQLVTSFALFASALFVAQTAGAQECFDLFSPSTRNYHQIIAETPTDAMGTEFREIFGDFIEFNRATSSNFESLALNLFRLRLEIAKKYETNFAKMMEPIGADGPVQNWKRRWQGESSGQSWSFGIAGHRRADSVWHLLNQKLEVAQSASERVNTSMFQVYGGSKNSIVDARVWQFPYRTSMRQFQFRIYQIDPVTYYIAHAADRDVPYLREKLNDLWRRTFDVNLNQDSRVQALSEFEWLWFWSNPFGRSGALIGDALSLLVQKEFERQGWSIQIRTQYEAADMEALSRPLDDYIRYREKRLNFKSFSSPRDQP